MSRRRARGGRVEQFYLGEFARAREHLARAIAVYDRAADRSPDPPYGQDLALAAWGFLGWADPWPRSRRRVRRAETALPAGAGDPPSLQLALALLPRWRSTSSPGRHAVRTLGDERVALSRDMGSRSFCDRAERTPMGDEPPPGT